MSPRHYLPFSLLLAAAFTPSIHAQEISHFVPSTDTTGGPLPYAIDHFKGQLELVPVHQTPIKHLYKEPATVSSKTNRRTPIAELAGTHAHTVLHGSTPAFYIHPDATEINTSDFAILQAFPARDRRIFAQLNSDEHTGDLRPTQPRHIVGLIASTAQPLPEGWIKITPNVPLAPGEYTLNPLHGPHDSFSTIVFDFSIDPTAPNAPDVVLPPIAGQSAQ